MATEQAINAETVRILRALKHAEGAQRTVLYRDLAEQMVDLREHYLTSTGVPDWTGRTGTYRLAVRELYAQAGCSKVERKLVQTSTRYHIGNLVRERISHKEADALALDRRSPLDRARERAAADRQSLKNDRQSLKDDREELRELIEQARALLASAQQPQPPAKKVGRHRAE
jgi:hypothetical protein